MSNAKQRAQRAQRAKPVTEKTLERISTALDLARKIVTELETGETVETEADGQHAISEAFDLMRILDDELRGVE